MSSLWFYSDPIDRLHQEHAQFLKSSRFIHHTRPRSDYDYRLLQWRAEERVSQVAERLGYRVSRTVKNAPWDLWVEGAKIEVKASTYNQATNGSRYQAAIRNHQADLIVFDCVNGTDHLHFIPAEAIGQRHNIAVWSYDPAESSGQWRPFLEETNYLVETVETINRAWQLPLF